MNDFEYLKNQIQIHHDLASSFLLSGILVGVLMSVVLFTKNRTKVQSLFLLNCFILLVSITNIDFYLCYTGLIKHVPWFFNSTEILVLLIGPVLFLFLQSLLTGSRVNFKYKSIHFILPIIYFLTQIGFLLESDLIKLYYYTESYNIPVSISIPTTTRFLYLSQIFNNLFIWLVFGSAVIYALLSYNEIRKYKIKNKTKSSIPKEVFSKRLILLFIITFIIVFAFFLYSNNDQEEFLIGLIISSILYIIAYSVIYESRYFDSSWLFEKYRTSGISNRSEEIYLKTKSYLEESKYFLNQECSLQNLSKQLSIPSNYISQSIHEITNANFNDFINKYRIDLAKKRVLDSKFQHLNQEGIGHSVGFSSKTSFYTAFKKYTGMTPAQYRKEHNQ